MNIIKIMSLHQKMISILSMVFLLIPIAVTSRIFLWYLLRVLVLDYFTLALVKRLYIMLLGKPWKRETVFHTGTCVCCLWTTLKEHNWWPFSFSSLLNCRRTFVSFFPITDITGSDFWIHSFCVFLKPGYIFPHLPHLLPKSDGLLRFTSECDINFSNSWRTAWQLEDK